MAYAPLWSEGEGEGEEGEEEEDEEENAMISLTQIGMFLLRWLCGRELYQSADVGLELLGLLLRRGALQQQQHLPVQSLVQRGGHTHGGGEALHTLEEHTHTLVENMYKNTHTHTHTHW